MPLSGVGAGDRAPDSPLQRIVIAVLRGYKFALSPLLPSGCRFHPTCSDYMRQAVSRYGARRGVWLGIQRLAKCHPFHAGGVDMVP